MRVLMIGDVFGRPGRAAVARLVPVLRRELRLDLVIANGENMAAGRGLTVRTISEMLEAGVDVVTSGNHVWDQREMLDYLNGVENVLRPLNYPPGSPGVGFWERDGVLVVNLMGRLFMRALDCPFRAADELIEAEGHRARVRLIDFHAEATSEKIALSWHLDGRVTAVVGTHTHVPTADARLLPRGTAALTDLGMCGAYHSVIGLDPEAAVRGFRTALPQRFQVAAGPLAQFNSAMIDIDESTGRARSIERVDHLVELSEEAGSTDDR